MKLGIVSDTHKDRMNALPYIMREFERKGVEIVIHCGDIEPKHLEPESFNNLPVICALIEDQVSQSQFDKPPKGWEFTSPEDRVRYLPDETRIYVGHKRSFEFLTGSESKLFETMDKIRRDYDGVRVMFSGHTHHQIFAQTKLVSFINPGAVEDSFDGYEFAVYDTASGDILFSRILLIVPTRQPFAIGIISDSLNISELDPEFWQKLKEELKKREVKYIIHCGNLKITDIGRNELDEFQIYYNLLPRQQKPKKSAQNWHQIPPDEPIVEINGYQFYVQFDLGAELNKKSELDLHRFSLDLRSRYPEISFVLCGLTNDGFLEEGQQIRIVNPGDAVRDRNFCVVTLPRTEICFTHVPVKPLPPLKQTEEVKQTEKAP